MILGVVVIASFFIALLTADPHMRPLALAGAFILCIGLPSTVGDLSVGNGAAIHISTILVMSYAATWSSLITNETSFIAQESPPRIPLLCHAIVGVVAVGSIMMTTSATSIGFVTGFVLNQMVAPYIFCILIYNASRRREALHILAGRFFASVCVFEAVVALAVKLELFPQPYASSYPTILNSWISLGTRQFGTLDHPLTLGLLLSAGIPMAAYYRSSVTTCVAIFMIVIGISLTESRIAAAGALVGVAYLLIVRSKSLRERLILLASGAVGYAILSNTGFLQGLLDRIRYSDNGSFQTRTKAAQLFVDNWSNFKFSGLGLENSKNYFLSQGLESSGESAAISYTVGLGLPLTILYFSLIVWLIVRALRRGKSLSPAAAAATIALASIQFYNSIATESAAAMILWATIGIALATPQKTDHPSAQVNTRNTDKLLVE